MAAGMRFATLPDASGAQGGRAAWSLIVHRSLHKAGADLLSRSAASIADLFSGASDAVCGLAGAAILIAHH